MHSLETSSLRWWWTSGLLLLSAAIVLSPESNHVSGQLSSKIPTTNSGKTCVMMLNIREDIYK